MATVHSGRKAGNFFSGQAEGEDRLAFVSKQRSGLSITYPFLPVKSFILDFSVIEGKNSVEALLLINEKADGGGQAFLLRQQQNLAH